MSFIGEEVTKMAEAKAYEEGGYMGLWKFRMMRMAHAIQNNSCCA
jgi:hypothetical protein